MSRQVLALAGAALLGGAFLVANVIGPSTSLDSPPPVWAMSQVPQGAPAAPKPAGAQITSEFNLAAAAAGAQIEFATSEYARPSWAAARLLDDDPKRAWSSTRPTPTGSSSPTSG